MSAAHSRSPAGHFHAAVWIDHHEARIFRFDDVLADATRATIRDHHSPTHLHHKANSMGSGHVAVDHAYLEQVVTQIRDARAIFIVGPSSAKHELYRHIEGYHPELLTRIVGVESADHPGDGPLLAHATQAFRVAARIGRPYSPSQS